MKSIMFRRRKLGNTSCKAIAANSTKGIEVVRNDEMDPNEEFDWAFRWGCTSNIKANRIVNEAKAIHKVCDKPGCRHIMNGAGVMVPETWFPGDDISRERFPKEGVVERPDQHHQGRHFDFYPTYEAFHRNHPRGISAGFYVSEFIPKDREFRVYVIQGRVSCVAEKFPAKPEDKAWNHALGGKFENVRWGEWPLKACQEAIKAALAVGIDFTGADVISKGEDSWILELNSAPSLTSEYRQKCFAKVFDSILEKKSKATIPVPNKVRGYLDLIHPAMEPAKARV